MTADHTPLQTEGDKLEHWLDEQLTGSWATDDLETNLRMAVSTIRDMGNIPKDYAAQPLLKLITRYGLEQREDELKQMVLEPGDDEFDYVNDRITKISNELEQSK